MQNPTFGIIMAGGIGSRFWPLSRNAKPKQFLDILGVGRTFIQQTFDRLTQSIPPENIIVVTSEAYLELVIEQLPQVKLENVLLEPLRRNTAPCIAYACYKLLQKYPNASLVVAPADHVILKEAEFAKTLQSAIAFAESNDALVTIGIPPNRPETGYGYIQVMECAKNEVFKEACKVKTFTEKPNLEMAKVFMQSGEFFWNSGIFIWTLQSIKNAMEEHLPEISKLFADGAKEYYSPNEKKFIADIYAECKSISIDYGVMEKSHNVYVFCADFGWSDLGTWTSLYMHLPKDEHGNALQTNNVQISNSKDCLLSAPDDKLIVLSGLSNYLVVDTNDVLMVCPRSEESVLKNMINSVLLDKGIDKV
ncbi:MAG: mannose-1-phosphate guanylyltransferase [Bacteroidales bacterium]